MGYDFNYSSDSMNKGISISFCIGVFIIVIEILE